MEEVTLLDIREDPLLHVNPVYVQEIDHLRDAYIAGFAGRQSVVAVEDSTAEPWDSQPCRPALPHLAGEGVDHEQSFFFREFQPSAETDDAREAGLTMNGLSGLQLVVPYGLQTCLDLWIERGRKEGRVGGRKREGGREGGREERGREGGRKGGERRREVRGRERERAGEREGGRKGEREGGREGGREVGREEGRGKK